MLWSHFEKKIELLELLENGPVESREDQIRHAVVVVATSSTTLHNAVRTKTSCDYVLMRELFVLIHYAGVVVTKLWVTIKWTNGPVF